LNRDRLKLPTEESLTSLCVLYHVLLTMTKLMAPFTPFFTEYLYRNLLHLGGEPNPEETERKSVHFQMIPEYDESLIDEEIEKQVKRLQEVIELGRVIRERRTLSLKKPVKMVLALHENKSVLDGLGDLKSYIMSELNCPADALQFSTDEASWCTLRAEPDNRALGKQFGGESKKLRDGLRELDREQCKQFAATGKVTIAGQELTTEHAKFVREFKGDKKQYEAAVSSSGDLTLVIDVVPDEKIMCKFFAREIMSRTQKLRKTGGLKQSDIVDAFYRVDGPENTLMRKAAVDELAAIEKKLGMPLWPESMKQPHAAVIATETAAIPEDKGGATLTITLCRQCVAFPAEAPALKGQDAGFAKCAKAFAASLSPQDLATKTELDLVVDGIAVKLVLGTDYFKRMRDMK
jgi:isoleucyl-tRNA synthetase